MLVFVGGAFGSPVRGKNPKFYGPSKHTSAVGEVAPWHATPFPPFLDFETDGGSPLVVFLLMVYLL